MILQLVILVVQIQLLIAYQMGTGIYDMTGPSVGITFMGYALPSQVGTGIHLRLKARAFVFREGEDDSKLVAYVNMDAGMGSDIVRIKAIEKANELLGKQVFSTNNLCVSGTHTHSGPGGFLQYILYQVSVLGFAVDTFNAHVNGIANSVVMAYNRLQEADMEVTTGQLVNSNINRSPTSYLLNPQEERDMYPEGDTDKTMTMLKLADKNSNIIGAVNWFAVHGTAMNNTNTLVSGDNKGYAEFTLEKDLNGADSIPGTGPIVAAFASCNLGDVSPNTNGAICIEGPNAGLPCDAPTSTCPDDKGRMRNEKCIAFGPGKDMFESTKIIGDNQYKFAKKLLSQKGEAISGPIDYRFSWVQMQGRKVTLGDGTTAELCTPAFGYSFAAGTTDGPGMFSFTQGELTANPFWNLVRDVLSKPTKEEKQCQHPKPILLNLGDVTKPHAWVSSTIPVQVLRIGNFFILATSSELTTMAGRRVRKSVYNQIRNNRLVPDDQEIYVVIAGLANGYQDYMVTPEEYQAQRYEAGSTLFGPNSLPGLIQEFTRLVDDMVQGRPSTTDPAPADILDQMISLHPPPKLDLEPESAKFGDVYPDQDVDTNKKYRSGKDVVTVAFYGANPRHRIRDQESYLTVEKVIIPTGIPEVSNPLITVVARDGDWSTKLKWSVDKAIATNSTSVAELELEKAVVSVLTIDWEIPSGTGAGEYRVCYAGDAKTHIKGPLRPIRGCSSLFTVI